MDDQAAAYSRAYPYGSHAMGYGEGGEKVPRGSDGGAASAGLQCAQGPIYLVPFGPLARNGPTVKLQTR